MSAPNPFMDVASKELEDLLSDDIEIIAQQFLELDTDESCGSSRQKAKRKYIERRREDGDNRMWNGYFAPDPVYSDSYFRRRFRMSIRLFYQIVERLTEHNNWFSHSFDAIGRKGLSPQQKCTAAIRQLAYDVAADQVDEYVCIGESTAILCLQKFCSSIIEIFGEEYLRSPNESDVQRLLEEHLNVHGFPGMLGSIDCMHWTWRNCPTAWKDMYTRGDHGQLTIMLEAIASHDLWIGHAYFGVAGSNNDINVINQSPLFNEVLEGNAPPCNFMLNGTQYTQGYYLADGIYPEWSTLVKTFSYPHTDKLKFFAKRQESARKDVERAFGVLQSRWAIIRGPARSWSLENISDIMYACIILHNMIVEDEGHDISNWARDDHEDDPPSYNHGAVPAFEARLERFKNLRSEEAHHAIRADLVEHLLENRANLE